RVNPFLPTVPVETESMVIDQDSAKRKITDFLDTITQVDQRLQLAFVLGDAGSGKSHLMKVFTQPESEKRKILRLYVTCPVQPDFVDGISRELINSLPKDFESEASSLGKEQYRTHRDFLHLLRQIERVVIAAGWKGLLVVIDELENAIPEQVAERVPHTPVVSAHLSLRQLRDLAQTDLLMNAGLMFAIREGTFGKLRETLGISVDGQRVITPRALSAKDLEQLFEYRYTFWKQPQPKCDLVVFNRVAELVSGNLRNA